MEIVCFVFARSGSKELPNKNIREFAGKPLIAWSIDQARSISRISRVIVSTDSDEISKIAISYGAEVPFLRPKELALDTTPEWFAWQHAISFLKFNDLKMPDIVLSLPATSPLRSTIDIERCIDLMLSTDSDVVIGVSEPHRNPYFNMVTKGDDDRLDLVINPEKSVSRRQDAPEVFDMTTVTYVMRPNFVLENSGVFDGIVRGVMIPKHRSIDIDTLLDFQIAEHIHNLNMDQS